MTFTLPPLPYAYDALGQFMSKETLEFHHDKHHQAYVTNGNNALKGTEWEGKSLEEIVKGSFGKNPAVFNNAGQHYNHIHFWSWMKPNGGGTKLPGKLEKKINEDLGGFEKFKTDFQAAGVSAFPLYTTSSYRAMGAGGFAIIHRFEDVYQTQGSITKIIGGHTAKAGVEYRKYHENYFQPNTPNGSFTFSRNTTAQNPLISSSTQGDGLASAVSISPHSAKVGSYSNRLARGLEHRQNVASRAVSMGSI